ncbi:MAG: recombinase family protein [Clostridia bacterium]|nr:recombinase family protein [Clostridia bacterium]
MKIGYIRVSTEAQNTARQEVLMEQLGVEKLFIDKSSGKNTERKQLNELMEFIRDGDTVIVESISRFARNTRDLLNLVDKLTQKKVHFISQKENIDTTTPTGQFMLTIFAAVATLERESILQRQAEGIAIAKEQGKYTGRKKIENPEFLQIYQRWQNKEITAKKAMRILSMKPNTFYRRAKELSAK